MASDKSAVWLWLDKFFWQGRVKAVKWRNHQDLQMTNIRQPNFTKLKIMKTLNLLVLAIAGFFLSGCVAPPNHSASIMSTQDYAAKEPVATSLFPSDQAVLSDEAVARILSSKLELPAKAKLALMKYSGDGFGTRYYGSFYWRDEQYLQLQQAQVDTLSRALLASEQIAEVTPLPTLMIPKQMSIPVLREAAVRMQSDLLLVYRVTSDTYSQYRVFTKDRVKAYSTCEVVLLDVRTGLVPFTRVVSREQQELKLPTDFDLTQTMRRAEQAATIEALQAAAEELVAFVKTVPKKSN